METHEKHKHDAPESLKIAVVTVSSTRTKETDESGDVLKDIIKQNGHSLVDYAVVSDVEAEISETVSTFIQEGAEALIVNGGTGIAPSDVTVEALEPLFAKRITGFGQLLTILSFQEIGTACLNSRATAGVIDGRPVFIIPGSPAACRLAAGKLIMPEIGHAVKHARSD